MQTYSKLSHNTEFKQADFSIFKVCNANLFQMAVKWTKLAGWGLLLEHTDEVEFAQSDL